LPQTLLSERKAEENATAGPISAAKIMTIDHNLGERGGCTERMTNFGA
jgi:hypothetical protein